MRTRLLVAAGALAVLPVVGLTVCAALIAAEWRRAFGEWGDGGSAVVPRYNSIMVDGSTIEFPLVEVPALSVLAPAVAISLILPLALLSASWPGRGRRAWHAAIITFGAVLVTALILVSQLLGLISGVGELPAGVNDEESAARHMLILRLLDVARLHVVPAALAGMVVPLVAAAARHPGPSTRSSPAVAVLEKEPA